MNVTLRCKHTLGKNIKSDIGKTQSIEDNKALAALAPQEARQAGRPKQEPSSGLRNDHKMSNVVISKNSICTLIFPPVLGTVTFFSCRLFHRVRVGGAGPSEGGRYAGAIYGHTTDSASLLAVGLMQLLVNKMAFLLLPF